MLDLFIYPMLSGIALPSPRVILVGKKSAWPLVFVADINMRLVSEPAYSCSHPQLSPWGQAHWAGRGCCQSAGGKRHCQVSLTLLAASPISPCHCQEAGSASSQCQRPTGCSLPASPNSLRQCQHQLALGEASLSEPAAHCQLYFDFHLDFSGAHGLTGAPWASWCM